MYTTLAAEESEANMCAGTKPGRIATEPAALWVLRHGQSEGNVVRDAAAGTPVEVLDIPDRDMDVPLSGRGREQAEALGRWWADEPPARRPEVVLTSPYRRARDTAAIVVDVARLDQPVFRDERLRE